MKCGISSEAVRSSFPFRDKNTCLNQCVLLSRPRKNTSKQKEIMQCTYPSNEVRYFVWSSVFFFPRPTKNMFKQKETMQCTCPSDAVRYICLKQCVLLSDAVNTTILVSRRTECPLFGKIKTALKLKGIRESVLHEKVASRRYLSNGVWFESFWPAVCKNFTKKQPLSLEVSRMIFKIN